jgi:sugar phosphate isomerase/epimerase
MVSTFDEGLVMKFAICQELFENWPWERQCEFSAGLGYTGLEVAPFTLAPKVTDVTAAQRQKLRQTAESFGLTIIGLHWLLAKTEGFHLTNGDPSTQRATATYLGDLARCCADLGGDLLVLGSPAQRNRIEGMSTETAMSNAAVVLEQVVPVLDATGVDLCLEPLTTKETNFLNTCAEAVELQRRVGHPRLRLHQDVKAMLSESTPIPELIRQFRAETRHFHVNDSNLLGPGMGPTDFGPILGALREVDYPGWVSVEVFDYSPGAEHIAEVSLRTMQAICQAW